MRRVPALALLLLLAVLAAAPAAQAGEIVLLKDPDRSVAAETAERERELGFDADHRYSRAVKGFAAELTPEQVAALRADPEVAAVIPNRPVRAMGAVAALNPAGVPAGVRRVTGLPSSEVRESADGAVAVVDTGIDLAHPDLNAEAGVNCIDSTLPPQDGDGHGTHVAGTIAARNDATGVTGVAPGTRVIAVKVLDDTGAGSTATVLCGIDWILANAAARSITVANFSLGGSGTRSTCGGRERGAYCNLAKAGIVPVVAAGNDADDFGGSSTYAVQVPAVYPEVLTVSAIADTDGIPGGAGPASCGSDPDDGVASFSNFATRAQDEAHLVAAPGSCIRSTIPGGGYGRMSGTSMATPHVAGLVALCKGESGVAGPCDGLTTPQIIARMRVQTEWSAFDAPAGRLFGPMAFLSDPSTPTPSVPVTGEVERDAPRPAIEERTAVAPPVREEPVAPAPQPVPEIVTPSPTARLAMSVRVPRLSTLRRTGLAARITCTQACRGTIRLRVSRATAKRLKLRSTTLASARVTRSGTVRLRLSREARTALDRHRGRTLKATLSADLRAGARPVRSSRSLTLRR